MEICLVVLEAVLKMQVMIANKIPINFQYVYSRLQLKIVEIRLSKLEKHAIMEMPLDVSTV